MSNSKKVASIAFTGAAATATALMTANPAPAAGSVLRVRVHKSGAHGPLYKGAVRAKNVGSASFRDVSTGTIFTCKKAFASGSVSNNSVPFLVPLGHMKKSATKWSSCTARTVHFTAKLTTSPHLVVSGYNAATGVTAGKLSGTITGKLTSTLGICHATISGTSVPFTYTNGPGKSSLSINPKSKVTLTVKSVTAPCFGQVKSGNKADFRGIYQVSTPKSMYIS